MSHKKTTQPVQPTFFSGKSKSITRIPTQKMADLLGCKPHTLRRSYCVNGNYLGLVPKKLPNGRLLWPYDDAKHLLED
ncbi:hypothetical protein JCM14469_13460 [Desulfatiferula olefinivorans]